MEIINVTVTAEASKAYQKYCVSLTAQNIVDGDIDILKNIAIEESLKGIEELAGNLETTPAHVTTRVEQPQKPVYNGPRAPRVGSYPQQTPKFSGPSEKQRNVLRKAGYSDQQIGMMKASEAAKAIEDYWSRTGYSKPQAPQYPPQYDNYDNGYDD